MAVGTLSGNPGSSIPAKSAHTISGTTIIPKRYILRLPRVAIPLLSESFKPIFAIAVYVLAVIHNRHTRAQIFHFLYRTSLYLECTRIP